MRLVIYLFIIIFNADSKLSEFFYREFELENLIILLGLFHTLMKLLGATRTLKKGSVFEMYCKQFMGKSC